MVTLYRVVPALALAILLLWIFYPHASDAKRIIAACDNAPEKSTCYETEVPALYPTKSIPELFTLVREIREKDRDYQFCHVLAHKLGEAIVAENPHGWIDAFALNPRDGLCSNGFLHGLVVGRFRNATLTAEEITAHLPDFTRACTNSSWAHVDRAICMHGIGHLFVFITDADMHEAVRLCNAITRSASEFEKVCLEGVFMQIFQTLEPEDEALIRSLDTAPTRETYRTFCRAFPSDAAGACMREAWSLFSDDLRSGRGIKEFCTGHPGDGDVACYETVATIIARLSLGEPERVARVCESFPSSISCLGIYAQAILEEDRGRVADAVAVCENDDSCRRHLAERAGFLLGNERGPLCAMLSDVRDRCLQVP